MMFEFDLIERGWIPCTKVSDELSATFGEYSIRQVLTEAAQFDEIVGDNPLVTISLYRFLLAVLHDCLQGPKDADEWGQWWTAQEFPSEKLNNYFDDNRENFDLFSEQNPFYQVVQFRQLDAIPTPALGDKPVKPIWKFFLEGEEFTTLFEHTSHAAPANLPPAQAARHLLAFQNFDVGGTQSRVEKGLTKEQKNLVKSADAGLLNRCAVALIRGKNLFETLMLNLIRFDPPNEIPFKMKRNMPAWRDPESIDPSRDKNIDGYLNLLSWQSRQVKLYPTSDDDGRTVVNDVVVMKGNNLSGEIFGKEQMVAFEKNSKGGWLPVMYRRERVLWRDSLALFQTTTPNSKSSRPRTFDWIQDLIANRKLQNRVFSVDFFGIGGSRAKPLFWRHERLPLPVKYLDDDKLREELREALKLAESGAALLRESVFRMATVHFLPEAIAKAPLWLMPALNFQEKELADKQFQQFKRKPDSNKEKDEFKINKGKPVGVIPRLTASLAPELRYWSRLETPFRKMLVALAEDQSKWEEGRRTWANDVIAETALLAFSEVAFSLGNSPRSLRSVSVARAWLATELNIRKKRYLKFEKLEDESADLAPEDQEDDEP